MIPFNDAAAAETAAEFDVLCVDCDALCEADATAPALSYITLCGFVLGITRLILLFHLDIVQYEAVRKLFFVECTSHKLPRCAIK
jgi:hypothetical protein